MKNFKHNLAVISIFAFGLLSCQKDLVEALTDSKVYQASVESFDLRTKTQLGADNSVIWSSEDCIMVYDGIDNGKAYQLQSQYIGSTVGKFDLKENSEVSGNGESFDGTLAVYPYGEDLSLDMLDGGMCEVSGLCFSSEQMYLQESFANQSFPMVAYSTGANGALAFKNVGGVLKLTLTGDYAVSKITLTGNSGEKISGNVSVTVSADGIPSVQMDENSFETVTLVCDPAVQLDPLEGTDFYISLPPTDFVAGFNVEITDTEGYKDVKKTTVRNVVNRSKILVMPEVSSELSKTVDVTGMWTCVETYSNGTKNIFNVVLNEDGTAELLDNETVFDFSGWTIEDTKLSISFARYFTYSGNGLNLDIDIDLTSDFMSGTGRSNSWAENWNTGGSSYNYKDLLMTKNEGLCHTSVFEEITVASAVVNGYYSNIPSSATCGIVISADGDTQTYYASGTSGNHTFEITDLDPNTTYKYWAFAEFDGKYVRGLTFEVTTLPMYLLGVWLCKETDSNGNVEMYTVELFEGGDVSIYKSDFNYEAASWSCKGRELSIAITIFTPGYYGGTHISDGLYITIEDPYDPVCGVGEAESEAYNTNTGGSSYYCRELRMTKQL